MKLSREQERILDSHIEADQRVLDGDPGPDLGGLHLVGNSNGSRPAEASDGRPLPKVETLRHLLERAPDLVPMVGGRRLARGETFSVAARAGVGKTTWMRGALAHGAVGVPYCGLDFTEPIHSVYFSGEGSGPLWTQAMGRVVKHLGLDPDALDRIAVIEGGGACGLRLNRPADLDIVRRVLAALKEGDGLDLACFDPFQRFAPGDENSSKDMGAAVDALLELNREFDIATAVPHHASQGGKGLDAFRGHTTFEGAIATGLVLTAPEPGERVLEAPKVRHARTAADERTIHLDFDRDAGIYTESAGLGYQTKSAKLLALLEGSESRRANDLAEELDISRSTIRDTYITPAVEAGLIVTEAGPNQALMVRRREPDEGLWEGS